MTTSTVETVKGPIPTSEMGTTLMHEHVFVLTPESQENWSDEWDEETRVADAIAKLEELRATGVTTIVDPTVDGLGRNIPRIQRVNAEVDLNIIVATGIYTYTDVPHFFEHRGPGAMPGLPEPMVELFIRDIRTGIQGTDIKAVFLKCAIDRPGLQRGVERIMRAVGQAHVETGVPVMVHTHPGSETGTEVARVLHEEGVDPRRVLLAHSGDSTDADHLAGLADQGFVLGMDRFGLDLALPFDDRVGIVAELCRRGYSDRMVLSQDASCYIDWVSPDLLGFMPNWNYLHVQRDVVPALLEKGVDQSQIEAMLVGTPRRWFEG